MSLCNPTEKDSYNTCQKSCWKSVRKKKQEKNSTDKTIYSRWAIQPTSPLPLSQALLRPAVKPTCKSTGFSQKKRAPGHQEKERRLQQGEAVQLSKLGHVSTRLRTAALGMGSRDTWSPHSFSPLKGPPIPYTLLEGVLSLFFKCYSVRMELKSPEHARLVLYHCATHALLVLFPFFLFLFSLTPEIGFL